MDYSGTSLQGTSWGWDLVPYTVEPLYKGQVNWDGTLSLIQWSLSTRDKLIGMGPCPLYSGASLQGTSWDGTSVLYMYIHTVGPLYKGHFGEATKCIGRWRFLGVQNILCSKSCPLSRGSTVGGSTASCHYEGHLDTIMHGKRRRSLIDNYASRRDKMGGGGEGKVQCLCTLIRGDLSLKFYQEDPPTPHWAGTWSSVHLFFLVMCVLFCLVMCVWSCGCCLF